MSKMLLLPLAVLAFLGGQTQAQSPTLQTVNDYNQLLPHWGISWAPGAGAINGYYPTFYTGFVMRSQFPERIHVRTARGNQTRVSVILDETTVSDYLYDLVQRYKFYKKVTTGAQAPYKINPQGAKFLPQLQYFNQIVESDRYQIIPAVKNSSLSHEELYKKSLQVLSDLNPGRVFLLKIDLKTEFLKWKTQQQKYSLVQPQLSNDPKSIILAINTLVWGRINLTTQPTEEILNALRTAQSLAQQEADDAVFLPAAFNLFKLVTGNKYNFKVLNEQGRWTNAVQCNATECTLSYPEFTTIYPTGSVMEKTRDEFGNVINAFATPGLWRFLNYSGRDVDNIRNEPYYGFVPKMDFEGIGNGFHNPAVRFFSPASSLKEALGIQQSHNTLWAVKRGGVSHGCLRTPTGHVWEMRQIFPVENSKMIQIPFFGNNAQDFDVYDIDGDGQLEVMGVDYLISYGLQGTDGLARREGTDFQVNAGKKLDFYEDLYGASQVFKTTSQNKYIFINPKVSVQSYLDFQKKSVSTRMQLKGEYPLYEQAYEKEKVQLYSIGSSVGDREKKLIRLMGRVKGCSPYSNKSICGQAAFEQEAQSLLGQ